MPFGRTIDKCLITTDLKKLTNFDLKVFLRQVPKLHHYTGSKNWCNFETWCNLAWCNLAGTTVQRPALYKKQNSVLCKVQWSVKSRKKFLTILKN